MQKSKQTGEWRQPWLINISIPNLRYNFKADSKDHISSIGRIVLNEISQKNVQQCIDSIKSAISFVAFNKKGGIQKNRQAHLCKSYQ